MMSAPPAIRRSLFAAFVLLLVPACAPRTGPAPDPSAAVLPELARQVEIRRTEHGVPHILAENLRAAYFALAWVQLEDHGPRIIEGMNAARGRTALVAGESRVDADARARLRHARAVELFDRLGTDTRDAYTGFAEGMNHFIRVRRAELPAWMEPDYTAHDVFARDVSGAQDGPMNSFRRLLDADAADARLLVAGDDGEWRRVPAASAPAPGPTGEAASGAAARSAATGTPHDHRESDAAIVAADAAENVGSNAWALAPQRTTSGNAILLRNPHLSWTAGYYEAHMRVPGTIDFYGDFRIGGPFTVIGGFNPHLGFATTNNASRSHEFYAFRTDPQRPDHIVVDGRAQPLRRDVVTVEYAGENGAGTATREFWSSEFGPVVHRSDSLVYVYRPALDGEFRAGEQWLEMMKAGSFDEWRDAMRIQARSTSNFTYADAAGNIFYVWVAAAPLLPHPAGGDTLAILATRSDQVWSRIAPFDSLPQLLNPPGGYVRNENDSPHYTNLNRILEHDFPFWVEEPRLRLRSQHGIALLHNDRVFSLEDVVTAKHSYGMLLADRVKDDLLLAVRAASPGEEVRLAADLLERWDNTAAHGSRGAVLFETWWNRYRSLMRGADLHAVEWSADEPVTTPRGLADTRRAADAFAWAVPETARRFGAWDAAWGDVHRVRRGDVDAPVGGCGGALGCFRVLNFEDHEDGRRSVNGGDGWVIAVEFGETPRAYSVLAYGQSPDPTSPYHDDQAALFAAGRMKAVYWSEQEIERAVVRRYHPGQERPVR